MATTKTQKPTKSAAIYVRRSHRDTDGTEAADRRAGKSLSQQETECRALAERLNLDVVDVFREREGTGASELSRKARPEYERALADLERGDRFRTLIVWSLDRADRRGWAALAPLFAEHSRTGARRIVDTQGLDTSDPEQKWSTLIRSEIAAEESANTGKRVRRAKQGQREDGRWLGGRPPFGLRVVDGKVQPDPVSGPVARRIADELLAGETLWGICKRLNAEGLRMPSGAEFSPGTLGLVVKSPAWAGLQSFRPVTASGRPRGWAEVYLNSDGQPVSIGEGIVTPSERALILAAVSARTQRGSGEAAVGRRPGTSLLSKVGRCSVCGGSVSLTGGAASLKYRCTYSSRAGGCSGFAMLAWVADEAVTSAFIRRLTASEPTDDLLWQVAEHWTADSDPAMLAARDRAEAAVAEARTALERVDDAYGDGILDAEAYKRQRTRLGARLADAEATLRDVVVEPSPSALLDAELVIEAWDANDDVARAGILASAVDSVTLAPARARGSKEGARGRVVIRWRDGVVTNL